MLGNKKGVSPVIAVVLMIVVAVAISLVVYVWASGFVSEKTGSETMAGDYSFSIETRDTNSTNIRNVGTDISFSAATSAGFVEIFDIYIDNVLEDDADITSISISNWNKGTVLTINFNASAGDEIKLIHKSSGTPIVFKLE